MPEAYAAISTNLFIARNILAFMMSFDNRVERLELREILIVVAFLLIIHLPAYKSHSNLSQLYRIVNTFLARFTITYERTRQDKNHTAPVKQHPMGLIGPIVDRLASVGEAYLPD